MNNTIIRFPSSINDPVELYHAACELRGREPSEVVRVIHYACDGDYDLVLANGMRVNSFPGRQLVMFEDWQRVKVSV